MSSIVMSISEKAAGQQRQRIMPPAVLGRVKTFAQALVLPIVLLAIWHFVTVGRPASLVPPPTEVWLELRDLAVGGINDDAYSGTLMTHLIASVSRVLGGFNLALIVALPLGMLIGRIELVRRFVEPLLQILRPIPVTAWLPLAMIIFGLGPRSAFFLVFLGAFYPILLNTVFGVRSVEPRLFEAASMLGCQGTAQFFRVVLPAALPSIFAGLRLGLGFSWVVIVVGEMTGVPTGLGAIIMEARQLSRTEIVICGMLVIGVFGFLSDQIVMLIGRRLLAWSPSRV
ncbi:ABC transporter permease [Bradyrhizobium sp. CCGUVB1N3]|nr:ABC transporter permease [Bradyrhizobium sp. CCGUVB1N3]MCP3468756.1 ABC transporter permease [Bradyrhizobium sp. CCGUVB1N3]